MPLYRYSPLLREVKHIRLLKLSPGESSEDLHVELDQVRLEDMSNYEALSYVWGSQVNPVPLLVGSSREHTILMTQNLATALRHLRHANNYRILWVDAVCIDQNNLEERSYQVTLMSDIYRSACRVVVWLGPEEEDSFRAFNLMHAIGSNINVDWISYSIKHKVAVNNPPSSRVDEVHLDLCRDTEIRALNRLLHRQWFERLWIRQEIGLATEAVILCGKLVMPWHLFRNAIFAIYSLSSKLIGVLGDQDASFISRIQLVYRICDHRVYLLDHLRTEITDVRCTDPRDRIYGMLSLLHPSHQNMGIIPDYSREIALVYEDVTLKFIKYWNSLSILFQCELRDSSSSMPTWVPDWSIDQLTSPISGTPSNASAYLESIATSKRQGTLSVAGVATATIQDVRLMHFGNDEAGFQAVLVGLSDMVICNSATFDNTEKFQLSAACDALCCGLFRHATIPVREDFPEFESVMQTLESRLAMNPLILEHSSSKDDWDKYVGRVRDVCHNRSFFFTTEGSVGIAPLSAKPGDIICVFLGCDSTILLRQTGTKIYQVIGQSYLSGVNTGEALLGPLPEHLQAVNHYDENAEGFHFAYWNKYTGEVQLEDPRLSKLLLNPGFYADLWRKSGFHRIKISVELLREAGVAVEYFNLV